MASGEREGGAFECNICLEHAVDPVVTLCGHLYCWSCLYRWMSHGGNTCPVCKAGVTRENVIPIYGRGGAGAARRPYVAAKPGKSTRNGGSSPDASFSLGELVCRRPVPDAASAKPVAGTSPYTGAPTAPAPAPVPSSSSSSGSSDSVPVPSASLPTEPAPQTTGSRPDTSSSTSSSASSSSSSSSSSSGDEPLPDRPTGRRPEPVPNARGFGTGGGAGYGGAGAGGVFGSGGGGGGGGIHFSTGFGLFPSLINLQFHNFAGGVANGANARPLTPEEEHQVWLSRILLTLGFVLLAYLVFL